MKKRRKEVSPNTGFLMQLTLFETVQALELNNHIKENLPLIDQINLRFKLFPEHYLHRLGRLSIESGG